jgi:hypothetical protein
MDELSTDPESTSAAPESVSVKDGEGVASDDVRDMDPESTKLAGPATIHDYREMVNRDDRGAISDLIKRRFEERYLDSVSGSQVHGFTKLAVSCLMVEALESFRQGWTDSNGKSEAAFCGFFHAFAEFNELAPHAHEFYRAIRCGILHQAETTSGWRVNRKGGPLIRRNGAIVWISAKEFVERLRRALDGYCEGLKKAEWDSEEWKRARKKLGRICKNSGVTREIGT